MDRATQRLERRFFDRDVDAVAADLLGRVITAAVDGTVLAVRLTEVESYEGMLDAASHAFRGRTPRTEVMFGPPGHLYTYFVYGMHWCANIVTGAPGVPSAVLLRAGEVVDGVDAARARRPKVTRDRDLARGPAAVATVLGFGAATNGADLCAPGGPLSVRFGTPGSADRISIGPRVGVSAAADLHRRFWITGDPTVSAFRAWAPRKRTATDRSGAGPVAG